MTTTAHDMTRDDHHGLKPRTTVVFSATVIPRELATSDTYAYYVDDAIFETFSHVIGLSLVAYRDTSGAAQDLVLGASSSVRIEAVDGVSLYTAGQLDLYTTTYSATTQSRSDKLMLQVSQDNSNATKIVAAASNSLSLQPTDANKTLEIGNITAYTSGQEQRVFTWNPGAFMFDNALQCTDILSASHLFAKDFVGYSNTERSNVGDVADAGFCFRMNDQLQIELVQYGKVVSNAQGGTKRIYRRAGIFGLQPITSNMESDVTNYDPFVIFSTDPLFNYLLNYYAVVADPTTDIVTAWGPLQPTDHVNAPTLVKATTRSYLAFAGYGIHTPDPQSLPTPADGIKATIVFRVHDEYSYGYVMLMEMFLGGEQVLGVDAWMDGTELYANIGADVAAVATIQPGVWYTLTITVLPDSLAKITLNGKTISINNGSMIDSTASDSVRLVLGEYTPGNGDGMVGDIASFSLLAL